MNDLLLIDQVRKFRNLYDVKSNDYKDAALKRHSWQAVGACLNATAFEVEKRWVVLRERFCRERNKIIRNRTGDFTSKWPLYEFMEFLEPYVKCRRIPNSMVECVIKREESSVTSCDEYDDQEDRRSESIPSPLTAAAVCLKRLPSTNDVDFGSADSKKLRGDSFVEFTPAPSTTTTTMMTTTTSQGGECLGLPNDFFTTFLQSFGQALLASNSIQIGQPNSFDASEENENYCKHLAFRLNRLLPNELDFVKLEFEKILYRAKCDTYHATNEYTDQMLSLITGLPTLHSGAKPVWILAHESQQNLAKEVVNVCKQWQEKASKEWNTHETRQVEFKDIINWGNFSDGFPNLFIKDVKDIAGKDVIFIASFHSVDVIFSQLSMLYQIPRYLVHSCTVILPYFPTGTMERIDLEGQVATAKTLATMLSAIPSTARGPSQIMIFDIHALQERFYFSHKVIPRLETAIPLIIKEIKDTFEDSISIAFPDDGAEKRFSHCFDNSWSRIVCHKTREGDKRYIKIKDGSPRDKNVIIIDDLVQSGATLLECAKVLRDQGALTVNAFVTHAVFPKESWRKFVDEKDRPSIFENFWITDSLPHVSKIKNYPPFKVLSLAGVIADSLLGFDLRQWN